MSCYVVEKNHILFLITAALTAERGGGFYFYTNERTFNLGFDNAAEFANELWTENRKSVEGHYGSSAEDDAFVQTSLIVDSDIEPAMFDHDAVQVLKSIACYVYQTCEHEGWAASRAKDFCEALQHAWISKLPRYSDAKWGAPEPIAGRISLMSLIRKAG